MKTSQCPRVQTLKHALDEEVHGLWISDEMAVKILARLDMTASAALKPGSGKNDLSNSRSATSDA